MASEPEDEGPLRPPKRAKFDPDLDNRVAGSVSKLKVEDPDEYPDMMADLSGVDLAMMDDIEVDLDTKPDTFKPAVAAKEEVKPLPASSWLDLHSSLVMAAPEPDETLAPSASASSSAAQVKALEPDDSLHMYWLDYAELHGKLYLIGKVLDKAEKKYVSCCVTIEGLERNLFILPRERKLGMSNCHQFTLLRLNNRLFRRWPRDGHFPDPRGRSQ